MLKTISSKQLAFCVSYGLALWLGAILLIRAMGPMGVLSGWGLVLSFALLVPGTLPAVLLTQRIMGPSKDQLLLGVTIISTIALLLAGLCFSFWPWLYGKDMPQVISAAGFILWGGGIGFVLALIVAKDK